jgi:hypothetical protein
MEWTRQVMGRIGLTLNETKTRIVDGHEESFDFLGYTYGPERHRKDGRLIPRPEHLPHPFLHPPHALLRRFGGEMPRRFSASP